MTSEERLVEAAPQEEDRYAETGLRPKALADFIGQDELKSNLAVLYPGRQRTR